MNPNFLPIGTLVSLLLSAVALTGLPATGRHRLYQLAAPLAILGGSIALALSIAWAFVFEPTALLTEPFAHWIQASPATPFWFVAICLLMISGGALTFFDTEPGNARNDRLLLLGLSSLGALSLAASAHLIVALCAWELVALPLTLSTANVLRRNHSSVVTVFVAEFFAFVLMALGLTLIFAQYQTLELGALLNAVQGESHTSDILLYTGMALWFAGMMTRLGILPFQGVLYERVASGPVALAGFSGLFLPLASVAFCWNFFAEVLRPTLPQWHDFLSALGMLTVWAGSLGMLAQASWRRFVAHALIAQAGWILLALVTAGATLESQAYLLVLSNSMAIATITFGALFLKRNGGTQAAELSRGLLQQRPGIGFAMVTGYLTLAGVPPTVGFAARAQLLGAMAADGKIGIAFVTALSIAVAAYPCLRRLAPLVEGSPTPRDWVRPGKKETAFFVGIAILLWVLGIYPAIAWPG